MTQKTKQERDHEFDQFARLMEGAVRRLGPDIIQDPGLGQALVDSLTGQLDGLLAMQAAQTGPPDGGLAELAGIGPEAADTLGEVRTPNGIVPFDETIT